jgi:hypothetical protein
MSDVALEGHHAKPKLTVTVGAEDTMGLNGTTVMEGEFPVMIKWHLGVTNYVRDEDNEGFEIESYSDRFVANPPKRILGKHYRRIRSAAIVAQELQESTESEAQFSRLTTRREIANHNAHAAREGWTIILNQAAIDAQAKRANEPDIDLAVVIGGGTAQ